MAKLHAPNKDYIGTSAGVAFVNGVGETTDPYLLEWFEQHGYEVEGEIIEQPSEFDGKTVEELKAYAAENDIDIGNSTSAKGIIKKIEEARKKAGE